MLRNSEMPYLSAFLLGVLLSVCPCTMATNVSALSCMVNQKDNFFLNFKCTFVRLALYYVTGRVFAYFIVGLLLHNFVENIEVTRETMAILGKIAGPAFLLIGLMLLDVFHIHGLEEWGLKKMNELFGGRYSMWSSCLLGALLAFAFCPYSAAIYFGVMIPMSCSVSSGMSLIGIFSVGTAIPLMVLIFLIKKGLDKEEKLMSGIQTFEKWYRRTIAVIFMITGLLFIWEYY